MFVNANPCVSMLARISTKTYRIIITDLQRSAFLENKTQFGVENRTPSLCILYHTVVSVLEEGGGDN